MREVCPGERRALPAPPSHGGIVRPQMSHEPNMPSGSAIGAMPRMNSTPAASSDTAPAPMRSRRATLAGFA